MAAWVMGIASHGRKLVELLVEVPRSHQVPNSHIGACTNIVKGNLCRCTGRLVGTCRKGEEGENIWFTLIYM